MGEAWFTCSTALCTSVTVSIADWDPKMRNDMGEEKKCAEETCKHTGWLSGTGLTDHGLSGSFVCVCVCREHVTQNTAAHKNAVFIYAPKLVLPNEKVSVCRETGTSAPQPPPPPIPPNVVWSLMTELLKRDSTLFEARSKSNNDGDYGDRLTKQLNN